MPPETDNLRLQEIFEADQKDREQVYETTGGVQALQKRDMLRRSVVAQMIAQGEVNTANDLYHAALIFQHGNDTKDFLAAHRLSTLAAVMGHKAARWLCGASLDRLLMSLGFSQVYGTQFEHNSDENKYQLRLPIEDALILRFEKKFMNIPTVQERLNQLNRRITTQ